MTDETPRPDRCETCRFFESRGGAFASTGLLDGLCRRHSPTPQGYWPAVGKGDWCGEWEPHFGADLLEALATAGR